jgi:hypothetical protein
MNDEILNIFRAAARKHAQTGSYISFDALSSEERTKLWEFLQSECLGGGYTNSWRGGGPNDTFTAYEYRISGFRVVRIEESEGRHATLINWGLPAIQHPASETTTFVVKNQFNDYLIDYISEVWL